MIHVTALIDHEPMDGLATPVPEGLLPARIDETAYIDALAVIQRGVIVCAEARVGIRTTVLHGAHIGHGARIGAHCVIGRNADIGRDVVIFGNSQIAGGTVIGCGSVIGIGVITTNDNHPLDYREKRRQFVTIGRRVQVGSGAILLPGITLGDGAIVAAGAVVTRDIPGNYLVRGINEWPAPAPDAVLRVSA